MANLSSIMSGIATNLENISARLSEFLEVFNVITISTYLLDSVISLEFDNILYS